MNRYSNIKAKRIARFERLSDYFITVTPDSQGVYYCRYVMINPQ